MGFTVTRPAGEKDIEFHEYARLLRQRGADLTDVPRVPEPSTGRRWVHVWDSEEDARKFARDLKKRTDKEWYVEEVRAKPSRGPFGPIILQMERQSTGVFFGLHPLTQALLQSAFPDAFGSSQIFYDSERWEQFLNSKRSLKDLSQEVAFILTGLTKKRLESLGVELIDTNTDASVLSLPPAVNGQPVG